MSDPDTMTSKRLSRALVPISIFFVILTLAGAAGFLALRFNDGPATQVVQTQPDAEATRESQVTRIMEVAVAALDDPNAMISTLETAMIEAARSASAGGSDEMAEALAQGDSERSVEPSHDALCELVETAAASHGLPTDFFSRLLWQESSFRAEAVSPVGALGIAQFMPVTAAERGLKDPLDPVQAIPASADFLGELVERFGNLGLAAAAYNAGPRRVWEWIAGTGGMPQETRDYVARITGQPVEYWRDQLDPTGAKKAHQADPVACASVVAELAQPDPAETVQVLQARSVEQLASTRALKADPDAELALAVPGSEAASEPPPLWGVQLAADYSEAKALSAYRDLQTLYPDILASEEPLILRKRNPGMGTREMVNIRIAAPSREAADDLCRKLRVEGAACAVLKN